MRALRSMFFDIKNSIMPNTNIVTSPFSILNMHQNPVDFLHALYYNKKSNPI